MLKRRWDFARNALFCAALCMVLVGPLMLWAVQRSGVSVTPWASSQLAAYLAGGLQDAKVSDSFTWDKFLDGTFQDALETEVGNHIPMKGYALLANAELQRNFIATSNWFFDWECYPTFYGSARVLIPSWQAITGMPCVDGESYQEGIRDFLHQLDAYSKKHAGVKYLVYVVADNAQFPSTNPAYSLVADSMSFEDAVGWFTEALPEDCAVKLLHTPYESPAEYYNDFFTSDLHWNCKGAFTASEEVVEGLGLENVRSNGWGPVGDIPFSGTESRNSLAIVCDVAQDCLIDYSDLYIEGDGEERLSVNQHQAYWDKNRYDKFFDFYGLYYCDIENTTIMGGSGDANLLLVSDSLGCAMQRILACSCSSLTHCNALRGGEETALSLSDQVEEYSVDAVVFVARVSDFATFTQRNPTYFF